MLTETKDFRSMRTLLTLIALTLATPAAAHTGENVTGFVSGFFHPLFGWDHVAAMVAVGLWGAFLGRPAIYILPIVFPMVMALGGALGVLGMQLPGVEIGIALSAVILGICVMMAAQPPLWIASLAVAIFAIFHGHAHGTELPEAANPFGYAAGFVVATGMLHVAGILFGILTRLPMGRVAVQMGGGLIAIAGIVFLAEIGG